MPPKQQRQPQQVLNGDSNPKSEAEVLYRTISGEAADFEEGEINNIVPTGNTSLPEHQLLLLYQDLLSQIRNLENALGINMDEIKDRLLEKINYLIHLSKSKDGYGLELIVTRKSHSKQNVNEQIREATESKGTWEKLKQELGGQEGQQQGGMPDGLSLKPENPDNFNAGENW